MRRVPGTQVSTRDAVSTTLRKRLGDVAAVASIVREEGHATSSQQIHRLRVAARKALVAFELARGMWDDHLLRRTRRRVRALRKASGVVRDCDVHSEVLKSVRRKAGTAIPPGLAEAVSLIEHDRRLAVQALLDALALHPSDRIRRESGQLREAARFSSSFPLRRDSASDDAALEAATSADLSQPARLHELRLAVKAVRYSRELRAAGEASARAVLDKSLLAQFQARLGEVNDVATLVDRLKRYVDEIDSQHTTEVLPETRQVRGALDQLRQRFASVLAARCHAAAAWVASIASARPAGTPLAEYLASTPAVNASVVPAENLNMSQVVTPSPVPAANNGNARCAPAVDLVEESQASLWIAGLNLAVIDVGSNSIRLLAVEMVDQRTWRVLGEERAMTRLAHGLADNGMLSVDAMARSVEAVSRFKAAAERLGVKQVRAFATAAVRDAANRADFLSLVRDRTGLELEVLPASEEGRLSYRSIARVHDLSHGLAAVVDMGGGSMEVVFSDDGVITQNTSMKLGAVRVTEQFGGAEMSSRERFAEMRSFIARKIKRYVRTFDRPPAVLAGCGGTFTTILTLSAASRGVMIERNSPALASLGPVSRDQLCEIIDRLRQMSLEERLRVPGLPADRADIVLAGLVAVERLMKHLKVDSLVAHPGGVREGLVLRIAEEQLARRLQDSGACPDSRLLEEAMSLARRCRYEAAHAEHVTALAISIYDQFRTESNIIPRLGDEPQERAILAASAVLHDVGMMVGYKRHHRHGATIIRQTGLPSGSSRLVEILAQLTRYHRKAPPTLRHDSFAALATRDQDLITRLSAVLRVADALDRSHRQVVRAVRLRFGKDALFFQVDCDPQTDFEQERIALLKKGKLLARLTGMSLDVVPSPQNPQLPQVSQDSQESQESQAL